MQMFESVDVKKCSLTELETIVGKDTLKYIELCDRQKQLQQQFANRSLDAKTRDDAFQKLQPAMNAVDSFAKSYLASVFELQLRLAKSIVEGPQPSLK